MKPLLWSRDGDKQDSTPWVGYGLSFIRLGASPCDNTLGAASHDANSALRDDGEFTGNGPGGERQPLNHDYM
jgi:hypothetical protein